MELVKREDNQLRKGVLGGEKMKICRSKNYDAYRGIRILERILASHKAGREKKLLALIGLINIASGGRGRG
jgi:hypothetical protein